MKILFGFTSGIATTFGYVPHMVVLVMILVFGLQGYVVPLVILSVMSKLLVETAFWGHFFQRRIDSVKGLENWRSCVNGSLFLEQPKTISASLSMFIDFVIDVLLVSMALKMSLPPVPILFALSLCQAVSAPIHGALSDYFSRKNVRLFSAVIAMFAFVISMEVKRGSLPGSYADLLGLNNFAALTQMLIILCVKGLFSGTAVIARADIADCIQMEAAKKTELQ